MVRSKVWRLLAVLAVFGLLAAACGDDDDDDATDGGGGDGTEAAGDALVIGNLRPETGSLAFLGPRRGVRPGHRGHQRGWRSARGRRRDRHR